MIHLSTSTPPVPCLSPLLFLTLTFYRCWLAVPLVMWWRLIDQPGRWVQINPYRQCSAVQCSAAQGRAEPPPILTVCDSVMKCVSRSLTREQPGLELRDKALALMLERVKAVFVLDFTICLFLSPSVFLFVCASDSEWEREGWKCVALLLPCLFLFLNSISTSVLPSAHSTELLLMNRKALSPHCKATSEKLTINHTVLRQSLLSDCM